MCTQSRIRNHMMITKTTSKRGIKSQILFDRDSVLRLTNHHGVIILYFVFSGGIIFALLSREEISSDGGNRTLDPLLNKLVI
jgi:hypothetical protein